MSCVMRYGNLFDHFCRIRSNPGDHYVWPTLRIAEQGLVVVLCDAVWQFIGLFLQGSKKQVISRTSSNDAEVASVSGCLCDAVCQLIFDHFAGFGGTVYECPFE